MTPSNRPGESEADFQRTVIEYAHLMGWKVAAFRKVRVQRANGSVYWETPVQADGKGWVDLALCRPPKMLFRELKIGRNILEPEQLHWINSMTDCGMDADVWRPEQWDRIERELAR